MSVDFVVLGAGMVGVCVALHLQKRGRAVALLDRRGAAEETSFGNAGMIQREAVFPHPFPRDFATVLRYARNRSIDARYHLAALPQLAPFLWRYWRHSHPARYAQIMTSHARLIEHCVAEHDALAAEAGVTQLLRRDGWIRLYRTAEKRDAGLADAERARRDFGVAFQGSTRTSSSLLSRISRLRSWADCIGRSRPRWRTRSRSRSPICVTSSHSADVSCTLMQRR